MLAMVASVLTLTGPIYMVCEPLVEEWLSASHVDAGRELQLERLALEASRLEESIDTFWANSEAPGGLARTHTGSTGSSRRGRQPIGNSRGGAPLPSARPGASRP